MSGPYHMPDFNDLMTLFGGPIQYPAHFGVGDGAGDAWGDEPSQFVIHLNLKARSQVSEFDDRTEMMTIHTAKLRPSIVGLFGSLRSRVLEVQRESRSRLKLLSIAIGTEDRLYSMTLNEWDALAALVICIPTLLELDLSFERSICSSSAVPMSFLLSLRQHVFSLSLNFAIDVNPAPFISMYAQQTRDTSSTINPFAIQKLCFNVITFDSIAALTRLGRSGPEEVSVQRKVVPRGREWQSLESFMDLLGRSPWLTWEGLRVASSHEEGDGNLYDKKLAKAVYVHNQRTRDLRNSTRSAATSLLRAARPLLFRLPISLSHPPKTSRLIPVTTSTSSRQRKAIVIPSLPYEIIDYILSSLSPGNLSCAQHRLVMNFADDRSTLKSDKINSRMDFLRRMNCWRESI